MLRCSSLLFSSSALKSIFITNIGYKTHHQHLWIDPICQNPHNIFFEKFREDQFYVLNNLRLKLCIMSYEYNDETWSQQQHADDDDFEDDPKQYDEDSNADEEATAQKCPGNNHENKNNESEEGNVMEVVQTQPSDLKKRAFPLSKNEIIAKGEAARVFLATATEIHHKSVEDALAHSANIVEAQACIKNLANLEKKLEKRKVANLKSSKTQYAKTKAANPVLTIMEMSLFRILDILIDTVKLKEVYGQLVLHVPVSCRFLKVLVFYVVLLLLLAVLMLLVALIFINVIACSDIVYVCVCSIVCVSIMLICTGMGREALLVLQAFASACTQCKTCSHSNKIWM
jgi:hypothetical protein